jgi:uncharacterized protein (UPF0333 family)
MKTIIILICIIAILLICLGVMIFYIRKLKNMADASIAAFANAKNALEECSVMIKKDLSNHLSVISKDLDNLFKNAEIRFNDNAKTISEKLEQAGFKVEK